VATASVTAPRSARADDAEQRSRTLFGQADALGNRGAYTEACPLFQAAHDLHSTNGTALRTADCYEKIGKYERALELYQWIVDHRDSDSEPNRVLLAMGRVSALQKQLGLAPVKPPPAGQPPPVVVTAPLAPTAPPAQPLPPPPPSRLPVYVSYGVGGAGLLVGAIFGGLALAQAKTIKNACKPPAPCPLEASANSADQTKATVSDVGFVVALAGAVTGTVLLLVNRTPAAQSALGPDGLTLRF
jgi:tetratricopeptide (TPR) repeat protein